MASTQLRDAQGIEESTQELLISADSHVVEDPEMWVKGLPSSLRDQAPVYPARQVGGHFQAHPGGWDPSQRVKEMAVDGVSGEILYPSLAMDLFSIQDVALQEACFRVYNDWIMEYCKVAPDRLFGIGMVCTYDIDHAIAELERFKREGLVGALVWQVPPDDLTFVSDHYERFWAAAQDLELPINLHILTGIPYTPRSLPSGPPVPFRTMRSAVNQKLLYAANALSDLILGGVLERYPRLKIVFVENEISWIPFYLAQYDKYWARTKSPPITMLPSEYFKRQVYATFFNDPPAGWLLSEWGIDNCMWSNDYPHPNSTWPDSRQVIARDLSHLPAADRAKLVRENVQRLFNLPMVTPLPATVL
jgi:predicted TIM-barrel fold metal-dependent hydrolase